MYRTRGRGVMRGGIHLCILLGLGIGHLMMLYVSVVTEMCRLAVSHVSWHRTSLWGLH